MVTVLLEYININTHFLLCLMFYYAVPSFMDTKNTVRLNLTNNRHNTRLYMCGRIWEKGRILRTLESNLQL